MEQDIKILEDYIELIKKGYCEDCNELCNIYGTPTYPAKKISEATEHLIKAYKELEKSNQEKAKMLTEQNRNLQISYDSLQELFELRKYKNSSIPVSLVEETIEGLNKEEQELQNSISNKEREEYSDANISFELMDIEIRRSVLQELLERRK